MMPNDEPTAKVAPGNGTGTTPKCSGKRATSLATKCCVGVLSGVVILSLILLFSCGLNISGANAAVGGVLWGLGLLGLGLVVGFLFGVPKSGRDPAAPGKLRANTNLEDISDWLSKIIVGTGLVELKSSPEFIRRLATLIAGTLGGESIAARSVGASIAVAFPAMGFLIGYLVTRVWLQTEMDGADRALNLEEKLASLDLQVKSQADNLQENVKSIATAIWNSDPHKGRFGGKSVANNRELSAKVSQIENEKERCNIRLEVKSTDPVQHPLTGPVTFFLHPTFSPDQVEVQAVNGIAVYEDWCLGAFTVGATADGGTTRLELDLVKVPGGSPEFYTN